MLSERASGTKVTAFCHQANSEALQAICSVNSLARKILIFPLAPTSLLAALLIRDQMIPTPELIFVVHNFILS